MRSLSQTIRALAIASFLPLGANLASAAAVVHWGGDYVTASRNLDLPALTTADTGNTRTWQYNVGSPVTPTTGYSAPTGRTSRIDGVFQNTATGGVSDFNSASVTNIGVADVINLRAGGTGDTSIAGMLYFQSGGFLNGYSALSSLDGVEGELNISALSVTAVEFRFTVLSGSQWYVSQATATTTGNFTLSNFGGTTKWATWTPTGAPLTTSFGAFDVDGSTLTNINAFGWHFSANRTNAQANFQSPEFIIVIPEPSTWALLAGGLTCMLFFRRRKTS